MDALEAFAKRGNRVELTLGANTTTAEPGTDHDAVKQLLGRLRHPGARVYLYHEKQRLFHPKLYLFDSEADDAALLIAGSSNWTYGGLCDNVEASVAASLDLTSADDRRAYDKARRVFTSYWQQTAVRT